MVSELHDLAPWDVSAAAAGTMKSAAGCHRYLLRDDDLRHSIHQDPMHAIQLSGMSIGAPSLHPSRSALLGAKNSGSKTFTIEVRPGDRIRRIVKLP
jgi:hypothetical protein